MSMRVKRLRRGIPDGYRPQRQHPLNDRRGFAIVSEWARVAAHELSDRHHYWIMFHPRTVSDGERRALEMQTIVVSPDRYADGLSEAKASEVRRFRTWVGKRIGRADFDPRTFNSRLLSNAEKAVLALEAAHEGDVCLDGSAAHPPRRTERIHSDLDAAEGLRLLVGSIVQRCGLAILTPDERAALGGLSEYLRARQLPQVMMKDSQDIRGGEYGHGTN